MAGREGRYQSTVLAVVAAVSVVVAGMVVTQTGLLLLRTRPTSPLLTFLLTADSLLALHTLTTRLGSNSF